MFRTDCKLVGSWLFGGATAREIVTVSLQVTAVADTAVCHSSVGWVRNKQICYCLAAQIWVATRRLRNTGLNLTGWSVRTLPAPQTFCIV